jgi:hypothetical protein
MPEVPGKYQPVICPQCGEMGMPDRGWTCKCGRYTHTVPLEQEVSRDNRIASDWLLWVDEREVDLQEQRDNILFASSCALNPAGITVIGKGQRAGLGHWQAPYIKSHPSSDTTGSKGTQLAALQGAEWIALIREVEQRLPWKMAVFLRLRRDCRHNVGRRGWIAYVQYNYAHQLAKKLKKKPEETWVESRFTFGQWWSRIIAYTVILASKRGLL